MKRFSITVSDEVAEAVESYRNDLELPPSLTSIAEAALTGYLAARGYLQPGRALQITPAAGSGHSDTSDDHDRVIAGR